jgi:hypothetical protein
VRDHWLMESQMMAREGNNSTDDINITFKQNGATNAYPSKFSPTSFTESARIGPTLLMKRSKVEDIRSALARV